MDITRRSILKSDWYSLCSQRWRSSIQPAKLRPGANCHSDHKILIAKFRRKMNKLGKITRPFGYNLNQIPYNYIVEVINRFKGLDLIECLRNYGLCYEPVHNTVLEKVIKTIPKKKKSKRQDGCLRRPYEQLRKEEKWKTKGNMERYTHLNAGFQTIARRDKKAFLSE